MKELLLILIPSLVTAAVTRLLTRRRNRVETDGCELDNLKAEMDLYRQMLQDTKDYLQEAREEVVNLTDQVTKLSVEVEELTKINTKLDNECKALRRLLKQKGDESK